MRCTVLILLGAFVAGCPDVEGRERTDTPMSERDAPTDDAPLDASADALEPLDAPGTDAPLPPARTCEYRSVTYDDPPAELDVGPTSSSRLVFDVRDLPDPSTVTRATLSFDIHDADHPGQEGFIRVNGSAPFDIPAMLAWDNVTMRVSVDVTGTTVLGTNRIELGPGPLDRSFFRVSALGLELEARVDVCRPPDPPPDPRAVRRELHYHEATFTNRPTWVVPCPPGHPRFVAIRDYAFTASGAEHEPTDCDGLYRRDSGERGTATFTFSDVVPSTYGVYVRYRSSANRNPRGALFIVNGEEQRIDQVDASGDYFEVLWGDRRLGGTVTVVLDSSREAESDSVTWVRLEPR